MVYESKVQCSAAESTSGVRTLLLSHYRPNTKAYQGIDEVDTTGLEPGDIVPGSVRTMQAPQLACVQLRQFQFVARDTRTGETTVAVASVIESTGAIPGERSVTVVAPAYNASSLRTPPPSQRLAEGTFGRGNGDLRHVETALCERHLVIVVDYLGVESLYGATEPTAVILLHGVEAALRLTGDEQADVFMTGHSGGGMVVGRAAELQPELLPQLNLVAVNLVAAPTNFEALTKRMNASEACGLLNFAAAIGFARTYPHLAHKYLTHGGRLLFAWFHVADWPVWLAVLLGLLGVRIESLVRDRRFFEHPSVLWALQDNSLGQQPPKAQVLIQVADHDPWVLGAENGETLFFQYNALGANVDCTLVEKLPWPAHAWIDLVSDTRAYQFSTENEDPAWPWAAWDLPCMARWRMVRFALWILGWAVWTLSWIVGWFTNPLVWLVVWLADQWVARAIRRGKALPPGVAD